MLRKLAVPAIAASAIALIAAVIRRNKILTCSRTEEWGKNVLKMLGRDKYLGGEVGLNGCIYCVPGTARYVLRIDPRTRTVETIGPKLIGPMVTTSLKRNTFKWLRAIRAEDGVIYGIPSNADRVLKITPSSDPKSVEDKVELIGPSFSGIPWKWHGAQLATNGKIYAVPCNHPRILCIDTKTAKVSVLEGEDIVGKQKWYGGLYASDDAIYAIPNCADQVLRIDTRTSTWSLFGKLKRGGWKWHGGILGSDGNVYGVPSHENCVLKIVPHTREIRRIPIPDIDEMVSPFSGKKGACVYKFGGGVMGADGCMYAFPSDSERVLRVHLSSETASLVGDVYVGLNKWQNGFLGRDSAVYGIPCNASRVIRIDKDGHVELIGEDLSAMKEKWEGGIVGNDGCLYCMPQQAGSILRIVPPTMRPDGSSWSSASSEK